MTAILRTTTLRTMCGSAIVRLVALLSGLILLLPPVAVLTAEGTHPAQDGTSSMPLRELCIPYSSSGGEVCVPRGNWVELQFSVLIAHEPYNVYTTAIRISLPDNYEMNLTITSIYDDVTGNYYEFVAHKSPTESGSYTLDSTEEDEASPVVFDDLDNGWYKVRGRRCIDSDRDECGT